MAECILGEILDSVNSSKTELVDKKDSITSLIKDKNLTYKDEEYKKLTEDKKALDKQIEPFKKLNNALYLSTNLKSSKDPKVVQDVAKNIELQDTKSVQEEYTKQLVESDIDLTLTNEERHTGMLETNKEYKKLVAELEMAVGLKASGYKNYLNSKAVKARTGGTKFAGKLEDYMRELKDRIDQELEDIRYLEFDTYSTNSEVDKKKAKVEELTKYYREHLENYKKAKDNVKLTDEALKDLQDVTQEIIFLQNEVLNYRETFTTGGQVLNESLLNNKKNPEKDINLDRVLPSDYFDGIDTSIDLEFIEVKLEDALTTQFEEGSTKSKSARDMSEALNTIKQGLDDFVNNHKGVGKTHPNNITIPISKEGQRGFDNVMRLFISTNEDGTKTFNESVKNAIALGTVNWLTETATKSMAYNRSNEDALKIAGLGSRDIVSKEALEAMSSFDGLSSLATEKLGSEIMQMLGLKPKFTTTESQINYDNVYGKLKTELGSTAILAMKQAGLLETGKVKESDIREKSIDENYTESINTEENQEVQTEVKEIELFTYTFTNLTSKENFTKDGKFDEIGYSKALDNEKGKSAKGIANSVTTSGIKDVRDILGDTNSKSYPYFKEGENITPRDKITYQGINSKVGDVPELQKDAITNQEKTAYGWSDPFTNVMDAIIGKKGDLGFLEYLGYKNVEDVHISRRPAVRGKNDALLRDLGYLRDTQKTMEDLGSDKMYFKWYVQSGGRFGIKSNTFEIQSKKLHRFATDTGKVEVSNSKEAMDVFKLALGQAFDISVDKMTIEDSVTELDKTTKELDKILNKELTEQYTEEDKIIEAYESIDTNEPEHAMLGLGEYIAYKEWLDGGSKGVFKSGIRLETDGITNGYILKLLQLPILDNVYRELNKGGVQDGTDLESVPSVGEVKSKPDHKDAYEDPADEVGKEILNLIKEDESKDKNSVLKKTTHNILQLFGESGVVDRVVKISRAFMKPPFMVFQYGAGIGAIIKGKGKEAVEKFEALLEDIANDSPDKAKEKYKLVKQIIISASINLELDNKNSTDEQKRAFAVNEIKRLDKHIKDNKNPKTDVDGRKSVLEFEFDIKILESIKETTTKVLTEPIKNVFNNQFGALIEANKVINEAMVLMMRSVKPALDRAIDEELNKRQAENSANGLVRALTEGEIDEIVHGMKDRFPIIEVPLSMDGGSNMLIAKNEKGIYNTETVVNEYERSGFTDLKLSSPIYRLIEDYTGGAVKPIHIMDGSIQSKVLSKFTALGVHDANYFDSLNALEGTKEANQATIELAKSFSLTTKILESLTKSMNALTLEELEALQEDKRYKNNKGELKPLNPKSIFEELIELQERAEEGRHLLFNNTEMVIEQYALEGSHYKTPKEEYIRQVNGVELSEDLKKFLEIEEQGIDVDAFTGSFEEAFKGLTKKVAIQNTIKSQFKKLFDIKDDVTIQDMINEFKKGEC